MGVVSFVKSDRESRRLKWKKFVERKKYKKHVTVTLLTKIKTQYYYLRHKENCIIIDGWLVAFYKGLPGNKEGMTGNWGDDINVWFIEMVSGKMVVPAEMLFFPKKRKKYCVIGTVIPWCINSKTVVWGSGYGLANEELKHKPSKVLAVRGPLTRDWLLSQGVDCPPVFGDPALLLPRYYQPKSISKNRVGLILHHRDWDVLDKEAISIMESGAILINLTQYDCWTDIIDQICSCDIVLSSSLHGMIVADAYGVPNVFVEFAFHHSSYFKYYDYFLSVNRPCDRPIQYNDKLDLDMLEKQARERMSQTTINTTDLEKACPFV